MAEIVHPPFAGATVHNQYLTLAGNTAGASTWSGTNLVYSGGSNVTISITGDTLAFSGGGGAAGTPRLNEVLDPNDNALFFMNTRQIQFQWGSNLTAFATAASRQGLFEIDVVGGTAFATDSTTHAEVVHIHQSSNNPHLHLLHLQADGTNATGIHMEISGAVAIELNRPISFDGGSVPMILGTSQSNSVANLNANYLQGKASSDFNLATARSNAWSLMGVYVSSVSPAAPIVYSDWLAGSTGYFAWLSIPP